MVDDFTVDELRILSLPIGELSPDELEVLGKIFIRQGLSPPIVIRGDL